MPEKIRNLLLLLLLASCWGPSFLFIKLALESFSPFTLVNSRILIAAVILYVSLRLKGSSLLPYRNHLFDFFVVAIFSCSLPFMLISVGEKYIDSSLAAIINSTVPIFTVILAHFFTKDDRLTASKISGILVSFFGVVIVFLPGAMAQIGISPGSILVLLAAVSYAIGITYARRFLKAVPFLVSATSQLIIAAIILLPITFVVDQPYLMPPPSISSISGVIGLAIFGTAIAFYTYYQLVQNASATYLSTSTLLFPLIGIVLGAVFLKEQLTWNSYVGSSLILFGLAIANRLFEPLNLFRKKARI